MGIPYIYKPSAGNKYWQGIAISADGTKMVANTTGPGVVSRSTDSGDTWSDLNLGVVIDWKSVVMSADGTKIVVGSAYGDIYTSTNSGSTWTKQNSAPSGSLYNLSCSVDASKIISILYVDIIRVYVSTDSGVTWTDRTPSSVINGVTSTPSGGKPIVSLDGSTMIVPGGGALYISTNDGVSWTESIPSSGHSWDACGCSSDGSKIVAAYYSSYIYTSTNRGQTWTQQAGSPSQSLSLFYLSFSCSRDFTIILANTLIFGSNYIGTIYRSTDSGVTWTADVNSPTSGSSYYISYLASSPDAMKNALILTSLTNNTAYIYVSISPSAPSIFLTAFSWGGTQGSTSAVPTWNWLNIGGAATSYSLTLYSDTNNPPTTSIVTLSPSASATSYAYDYTAYVGGESMPTNGARVIVKNISNNTLTEISYVDSNGQSQTISGLNIPPGGTYTVTILSNVTPNARYFTIITVNQATRYRSGGGVVQVIALRGSGEFSAGPTVNTVVGNYYKLSLTGTNSIGSSTLTDTEANFIPSIHIFTSTISSSPVNFGISPDTSTQKTLSGMLLLEGQDGAVVSYFGNVTVTNTSATVTVNITCDTDVSSEGLVYPMANGGGDGNAFYGGNNTTYTFTLPVGSGSFTIYISVTGNSNTEHNFDVTLTIS
jgi:hypothetical protein